MTSYLIMMYVISLALGYVLAFTQSTLEMGRTLSDAGTTTGYQDAITPPRFSAYALLIYAVSLGSIIYGIWWFGLIVGLGTGVGLFIAAGINIALVLPKINSKHFRNVIVHSMIKRHAVYLKSGDALRASVLAELLVKSGVPVNEHTEQGEKDGDS